MKTLEELKISPTPWKLRHYTVLDADYNEVKASSSVPAEEDTANNLIMLAAPDMYEALRDLLFGNHGAANCRKCKGAELGNCKTCRLGKARFALEKAEGEVYCG